MATKAAVTKSVKYVKPILSVEPLEARRRVLSLYKSWYRSMPFVVQKYTIPKSIEQCREKLKELFLKNKDVKDIRVIDLLVIKGQMELKETMEIWKQKGHIMNFFKESQEPKPKDFLSKFLS